MVNWTYKLEYHGKALREKINGGGDDLESCKATLQALKDCYDQIKRMVKDNWFNFESDYENLKYYIDVLNNMDLLHECTQTLPLYLIFHTFSLLPLILPLSIQF